MSVCSISKKSSIRLAAAILTCCSSASLYAWDASQVISVKLASVGSENQKLTLQSSAEGAEQSLANVNTSGNYSYSIGWGLQEGSASFMLEYYAADIDVGSTDSGAYKSSTQSLYYSGYWMPTTLYNVKAVVGAGVGYGFQKYESLEDTFANEELTGGGLSYKFSLGAQYQLLPQLGLYCLFEQQYFDSLGDSYLHDAGAGEETISRSLPESKLTLISVGASYFF